MPLLAPPDTPHDIPRSIQTAGGRASAINIHFDYFTSRRIIHAVLIGVCLLVHQVGADAPSAAARIAFAVLDVLAAASRLKLEATSATTGVGLPIVSCEHLIGSRILPPRLRLTHTAARIAGVWLSAYLAAEAAIAKINPYGAIDVGSSPLAAQLAGLRMAAIGALAGSLSLPTIAKVPLLIGCGGLSLAYVNCGSLMGAITSLSFLIVAFAAAHADEAQFVARRLTETTSPRDEPARAIDPPPHGVYVGRGRGRRPYIPPEAPPAPVTPIRPLYENPDLGRLLASAVVTAWSAPAEASAPSPSSVADDDPASPHTMGAAIESIPRFMRNLLAGVELHRALAKEIRGAKCSTLQKSQSCANIHNFHPPLPAHSLASDQAVGAADPPQDRRGQLLRRLRRDVEWRPRRGEAPQAPPIGFEPTGGHERRVRPEPAATRRAGPLARPIRIGPGRVAGDRRCRGSATARARGDRIIRPPPSQLHKHTRRDDRA